MDDSRPSRGGIHISVKRQEDFKVECSLVTEQPGLCPDACTGASRHTDPPTVFVKGPRAGLNSVWIPCLGTESPSSEARHQEILWVPFPCCVTDFSRVNGKDKAWGSQLTHQLLLRAHLSLQDLRSPVTVLTSWRRLHPAEGATPWAPERSGISEQGQGPWKQPHSYGCHCRWAQLKDKRDTSQSLQDPHMGS